MKPSAPPSLVAVIEDDPGLCADLTEFLQLSGLAAQGFASAEEFFRAWPASRFDLLLLDIALPGVCGLEVARRVRAQDSTGIIMLTGFNTPGDQVAGLGAGADAYLAKGSSLAVIEASCRAVLRRLNADRPMPPTTGPATGWRLSNRLWSLKTPNNVAIPLTHTERVFLAALFDRPGESIAREKLLVLLDKQDSVSNMRNLDNAASRLRRKIRQACGLEFPVRPSYGRGYTFIGDCEIQT